jgi:hypothetical protein
MLSSDFDTGATGVFFKADDLGNDDWELTISGMSKKEFEQTKRDTGETYKEWKPIFTFEEDERAFVCNRPNRKALAQEWGNDMFAWIGKKIILYRGTWPSGVKGIMVRVPKAVLRPGAAKDRLDKTVPDVKEKLDDEIPF